MLSPYPSPLSHMCIHLMSLICSSLYKASENILNHLKMAAVYTKMTLTLSAFTVSFTLLLLTCQEVESCND